MEKTNFEMLEELYNELLLEKPNEVNQEETIKICNILGMVGRSLVDCNNLQQFATLFYEHKVFPIHSALDKLVVNDRRINNKEEFNKLMGKRDRYRQIYNAIDITIENWIYSTKWPN